jgi:hypothetical protein
VKGVTIMDRNADTGFLAFDLSDIVALLDPDAMRSNWTARDVECLGGDAARRLEDASDRAETLAGAEFIALAHNVDQVIDGEFSARLPSAVCDWITIRSVDSSAYDVLTDRDDVLLKIRARFRYVESIPLADSR